MTQLEEAYSKEKLDLEREIRFNRDIQVHEMELMNKMSRIKAIMVCLRSPLTSSSGGTMD